MIHHQCHDSSEVNIKGQKVGSGSVPENLHSFPEKLKKSSHSLAYEITQPIKTSCTIIQGLSPSEMARTLWSVFLPRPFSPFETDHILTMECVSLWNVILSN